MTEANARGSLQHDRLRECLGECSDSLSRQHCTKRRAARREGGGGASLAVEIRSVNGRFLDLAFRLPDELRGLEPALRELLTARFKRGKIELRISGAARAPRAPCREPTPEQLAHLARVDGTVRDRLPHARALSVHEALQWCRGARRHDAARARRRSTPPRRCVERLARGARARRRAPRRRAARARRPPARARRRRPSRWCPAPCSGSSSASSSAGRKRSTRPARRSRAARGDRRSARSTKRPPTRSASTSPRSWRGCARTSTRSTRLLDKGGEIGKRLDFLIQELLREANTLGSKSPSIELTDDLGRHEGRDRAAARAGPERRVSARRWSPSSSATRPTSSTPTSAPRRREALAAVAEVRFNDATQPTPRYRSLVAAARGCDALIAYRQTPGPEALFRELPELLRLHPLRGRHPHVDVAAASAHGVLVDAGERGLVAAVAEWVIAVDDRPRPRHRALRRGRPATTGPSTPFVGRELRGATLGVIGLGRIGARLPISRSRSACACSPPRRSASTTAPAASATSPLVELLGASDFVVCLAPAQADTDKLMNAAAFAAMRRGAFFVNASRGELVDDAALARRARRRDTSAAPRSTSAALPTRCRHRSSSTTRASRDAAHRRPDAARDRAPGARDRRPAREAAQGRVPVGAVNADHADRWRRWHGRQREEGAA